MDSAQTVKEKLHFIVRSVLNSWSAYQLGIANQTGGDQTKEKDEWFCDSVVAFLSDARNLQQADVDEFADWLDSIVYDEFHLQLEDGSVELTAALILRLARLLHKHVIGGGGVQAPTNEEEALRKKRAEEADAAMAELQTQLAALMK